MKRPPSFDPSDLPPLPPYMREYWNENSGLSWFRAEASTRMIKAGFPIPYMSFGSDLPTALALYDTNWAPVLHRWQENAASIPVIDGAVFGSLEWFYDEFKTTDRYKNLAEATKLNYHFHVRMVLAYVMKDNRFGGQPIGKIPLKWLTEGVVDDLYAMFVVKIAVDKDGNEIETRREATAARAFGNCRAMINALKRKYKHLLPERANPFSGMWMPHTVNSPPPVPHPHLARFIRKSDEKGLASVSAIALFAFEFEVRPTHFPFLTDVGDFRGPNHEDEILVHAEKVGKSDYFYLENDDGEPLYPALTKRLAKLKGKRKTGPMFLCERADKTRVWRLRELRAVIKEICEEAGLPPFTLGQFRKGGLSESGRAGLTPAQITSQSFHGSWETLQDHYIDNNSETAMAGQEKRLAFRRKKAKRGIDIVT